MTRTYWTAERLDDLKQALLSLAESTDDRSMLVLSSRLSEELVQTYNRRFKQEATSKMIAHGLLALSHAGVIEPGKLGRKSRDYKRRVYPDVVLDEAAYGRIRTKVRERYKKA